MTVGVIYVGILQFAKNIKCHENCAHDTHTPDSLAVIFSSNEEINILAFVRQ